MKKVIIYIFIITVFVVGLIKYGERVKDNDIIEFKVYFYSLIDMEESGGSIKNILPIVDREINKVGNSKRIIGINLLVRQYYFHIMGENDIVVAEFKDVEKHLIDNNMLDELVHLYSLIAQVYKERELYSRAYVYIYKGKRIANELYNKYRDDERLSSLLAIMYQKAVIAFEVGLEEDAETVFQEAENLRKTYNGDERRDIYHNIVLYYQYKKDDSKVIEYAEKSIDMYEKNRIKGKKYLDMYIDQNIILAKSYLSTNRLNACKDIIKNLENNNKELLKSRKSELYKLGASIYEYYDNNNENMKFLELAYYYTNENYQIRNKLELIYKIIKGYESENNTEKLVEWGKEFVKVTEGLGDLQDNKYVINEIIEKELQKADYDIEILKLHKYNQRYIIAILIMIVSLVLVFIINEGKNKSLLKDNIVMLQKQIKTQLTYYEERIQHLENIRSIKHDMKSHIGLLNKLIDEKKYENAKNYMQKIDEKLEDNEKRSITKNNIIAAILSEKIECCREKNIKFEIDMKLPEIINIDDFDLCVIYSNLLDNSIEACEQIDSNKIVPYIKLKSIVKNSNLYISIYNTKCTDIAVKGDKFITTKANKYQHGIGMENVKKSIKNNGGYMKVDYTDSEFVVKVLLRLNKI